MIMPYNLELERKYSMTLSELYELANRVIVAMQRDIADFAQFKILPANLTALEALTAQYYDNLNDEMYKAEHSYAIQLRNELRETLQHYLKRLALAAKNTFKNAPSIYNALVLPNVAKLTDKVFVVDIGNVYKNAVQNKTKLEAEGIDTDFLTNFESKLEEYSEAMRTVDETSNQREAKTEERIKIANTLHETLSKYCDYGKFLYEDVSPSKYNDYLMTPTSAGGLKPPTGLKYLIDQNTVVWDAVANATSYELQYSPDGADWSEAYGGADNMVYYFPPQEGWAYFRCRARNANGYGEYSAVLKTGYYQVLPPPSNIHAKIAENTDNGLILTWDEVPSAANYKIYTSIVPIESPAGAFTMLEKTASTKYTCELERDKRHYFQLISENSSQTSLYSTAVFIDVYGAMPS